MREESGGVLQHQELPQVRAKTTHAHTVKQYMTPKALIEERVNKSYISKLAISAVEHSSRFHDFM